MANYAFIDSQNLNVGIRSQGWSLDWRKFLRYLEEEHGVTKSFIFIGFTPGNEELYTYLQKAGYVIVFKHTHESPEGVIKGNVDTELVLHAMIEYKNYDKAVIVSGDSDFFCLVEYLHNQNKLHKILVPNRKYASIFRNYDQFVIRLDELKRKLRYISRRSTQDSNPKK